MTWSISVSEEVRGFLKDLTNDERTEVSACISLLRELGPNLRRPQSGTLRNSKHSNMKELRVPYGRKQFRILYAFDTEQNAILLVGGDKVPLGDKRWYPKFIGVADKLYDEHLDGLKAEIKQKTPATKAVRTAKKARGKGKQK